MIRVILYLLVIAAAAFAAIWLIERPGTVTVDWLGTQVETNIIVAGLALVAAVAALIFAWWLVSGLWRMPNAIARSMWDRRRQRQERSMTLGLLAVASGDLARGRRYASEVRRIAPDAPLSLLLSAQAAQLDGNAERAGEAFRAMLNKPETRLLGLRGLFAAARRDGNLEAARQLAQEAFEAAPTALWSSRALLEFQGTEHNWAGALETLGRLEREGVLDRDEAGRQRAVLLTAQAMEREREDLGAAALLAEEALRYAPDLVPAAVIAARHAIEREDIRRAVKIIEKTWKHQPHPELAHLYLHVRPGDSAQDRLARIHRLTRIRANHEEGMVATARAAMDAREWREAREALAPLLRGRPQARICAMMAEIEMEERQDEGHSREWLARALRASPDPAWTADGYVSDKWLPFSPVTGAIGAFQWKVPVEAIGSPALQAEGEALAADALAPAPLPRPKAQADVTEIEPEHEEAAPSRLNGSGHQAAEPARSQAAEAEPVPNGEGHPPSRETEPSDESSTTVVSVETEPKPARRFGVL